MNRRILIVGSDHELMREVLSRFNGKDVQTCTFDEMKDIEQGVYDAVIVDKDAAEKMYGVYATSDKREMKANIGLVNSKIHLPTDVSYTFHVEQSHRVGKGERKRNRKDRWK